MDWLPELLREGQLDELAMQSLARGFTTWLEAGGSLSLQRCLGLPANPERVRLAMRDGHLRDAAQHIDAPTDWQRAGLMLDAARQFELRRWACWWSYPAPPPHASDLDRCLFLAMRAGGGALPKSQRQYFNILRH